MTAPLLAVRELRVAFGVRSPGAWPWQAPRTLVAVDGVSFDLAPGETLGVVGESGCGKSTLARALLNLVPAQSGSLAWEGRELRGAPPAAWTGLRRQVQMVFQDPLAALNPRMTVGEIVAEPLRTHAPELDAAERLRRVCAMLERVGLSAQHLNRYPHAFSGGQCQRIGIARALVLEPRLLVCDEPVSALDVSIQAQIINLLRELQAQYGLALVFIAHDLAVVRHISQRVLVMHLGRVAEVATRAALFGAPRHPYTQALLAAVPVPDPSARARALPLLQGELPSPLDPPSGCTFRTRCPKAQALCAQEAPPLLALDQHTQAACWFA